MKLFYLFSIKYWKNHKKRLFSFLTIMVIAAAAVSLITLFIRAEKETTFDGFLTSYGDYDRVYWGITDEEARKILSLDVIEAYGIFDELGYVGNEESGVSFKAACFRDKKSKEIYHMKCIDGDYPTKPDEIAIDKEAALQLGIKPAAGKKMTLSVYNDKNEKIDKKEFTISGIFNQKDNYSLAPWKRLSASIKEEDYSIPSVFMYDDSCFEDYDKCSLFIQINCSDQEYYDQINKIMEPGTYIGGGEFYRNAAYSEVLGIHFYYMIKGNSFSITSFLNAVRAGKDKKDLVPGFVIPLVCLLLCIMVFIALLSLMRNVINDRKENLKIYQCLGMGKKKIFIFIGIEMILLAVAGGLGGMALGSVLFCISNMVLKKYFGIVFCSPFKASVYVKMVTVSPLAASLGIVCLAALISFVILCVVERKKKSLINDKQLIRKRRVVKKNIKSWRKLLNNRLNVFSGGIAASIAIVMAVIVTGFVFFSVYSDYKSREAESLKKEKGLDEYQYICNKKTINNYTDVFALENHHEYGISKEKLEKLIESGYVCDYLAETMNLSSRFSVDKSVLNAEDEKKIKDIKICRKTKSDIPLLQAGYEAETAMKEGYGYKDEHLYSLPSVGINREVLNEILDNIRTGTPDTEKLVSGEEAILVVTEDYYDAAKVIFDNQESLGFSDIILQTEAEKIDIAGIYDGLFEPVYDKKTIDNGNEYETKAYVLGQRKDFTVKISGIAVIDTKEAEKILAYSSKKYEMNGMTSFMPNLVSGNSFFEKNGLPDVNYTKVMIELKNTGDYHEFENVWYEMVAGSTGVTFFSADELMRIEHKNETIYMGLFGIILATMALTGIFIFTLMLGMKMKLKNKEFSILRAIGISKEQIRYLFLKNNLFYVFFGLVMSVVSVSLLQSLFNYIKAGAKSGKYGGIVFDLENEPWVFKVPYFYNLFEYGFTKVLLLTLLVTTVMVVILTEMQVRRLTKADVSLRMQRNDY